MIRQEDFLLTESTDCGEASDGFREPGKDRGSRNRFQPFEFTGGVEIIPSSPRLARIDSHHLPYIHHGAKIEPSQRWYDNEEDGENETNNHEDSNASRPRAE